MQCQYMHFSEVQHTWLGKMSVVCIFCISHKAELQALTWLELTQWLWTGHYPMGKNVMGIAYYLFYLITDIAEKQLDISV